jgi:hypothetical protein
MLLGGRFFTSRTDQRGMFFHSDGIVNASYQKKDD